MSFNLIITAVDQVPHFQDCMRAFLSSLAKNAPDENVLVCLMNCSIEYGRELKKRNPKVRILHQVTEETNPSKRNYVRHGLIANALKDGYEKVAWIDDDCLVRKPLDGFWDGIERNTIKFWLRKKKKKHVKFQGGVYVLGNSIYTYEWTQDMVNGLKDAVDWYTPQELMYTEFARNKNLKHVQLKEKYNDSRFKNDSVIWHCKHSHFDELKYQNEYRGYLNEI